MHRRAAELLVVGLLAGGHLHERRTAEEHLRAAGRPAPRSRTCPARTRRRRSSCRTRARSSGCRSAESCGEVVEDLARGDEQVGLGRAGRRRPTRRGSTTGSRLTRAISSARRFFFSVHGFIEPPRTVGSCAMTTHSTPDDHADAGDDAPRRRGTRCPTPRAARARGTASPRSSSSSMRSRAGACPGRGGGRRSARRRRRARGRAAPRARRAARASPARLAAYCSLLASTAEPSTATVMALPGA